MDKKTQNQKYEFQIEKLKSLKDKFIDIKVYEMWSAFFMSLILDSEISNSLGVTYLRAYFMDFEQWYNIRLNNISWRTIQSLGKNKNVTWKQFNLVLIFMIKNEYVANMFSNDLVFNYLNNNIQNYLYEDFFCKETPNNWCIFESTMKSSKFKAIYLNGNIFTKTLLKEFIERSFLSRAVESTGVFYENFYESFQNNSIADSIINIESFSSQTFEKQFDFYMNNGNRYDLTLLVNFYVFLFEKNQEIFKANDSIDYYILIRTNFINEYSSGARKVLYNPIECAPIIDKWILDFNGYNVTGNKFNDESRKLINFLEISNKIYRNLAKEWFWNTSANIQSKLLKFHYIKPFLNYINNLKAKKILSFHVNSNDISDAFKISLNEIMAYKFYIDAQQNSKISINSAILAVRNILQYFKENNFVEIEDSCFYYLKSQPYRVENNAKSIPDNELKLLSELMNKKSQNSYNDKLNYAIFYIALETEFRISHILNLTIDCVKETSKPNEYVIKSKTKTSQGEEVEYPITLYTKRHIDEIKNITTEMRNECIDFNSKKYLFLSKSNKQGVYTKHKEKDFNNFMKKCCNELNIERYTASNLRDTHITKAHEHVLRNNLSDETQLVLTKHKSINTDQMHYIEMKIIEMLETVHGTIIGNIDVMGNVEYKMTDTQDIDENLVSNGCGYCSNSFCNELSYLDCLMCKFFVATVDRIPYFEEQIKVIDYKIQNVYINHDKEDFVNIKQLLLNYLKKLYLKKEEVGCQNL